MGQRVAQVEVKDQKQEARVIPENEDEPNRLSLAELFDEDADDSGASDESQDAKTVDHIDKMAKRLSLTPEQAYAIRIPMPDGAEPLTIGELKDKVKDLVSFETREAQFDQRRSRQEGELIRAQSEMRSLLAMLPQDAIKPEMVERVRKQHEAKQNQERRLTLQVIPEWDNEETRESDIAGMSDFLQEHGFDEHFIATIVDHRALRFLRVMWQRDVRIKKALANVKDDPGKGARNGQRSSGKARIPPKVPGKISPRHERRVPDERTKIMDLLNRSEN